MIKRNRVEKEENSKKFFILQMLTHELRTPTTSIKLLIESFRDDYDQLPLESQKAFLRLCEETQRLSRVVEASKNYLSLVSSDLPKSQLQYSINAFIQDIIDSYALDFIYFKPLSLDYGITTPSYWLEICIRNLLDNAIHHGQPPITISLQMEIDHLSIQIQDQGTTIFENLDDMVKPFFKDHSSKGIGLGLAIVKKVALFLNMEFEFHQSPTIFALKLRGTS